MIFLYNLKVYSDIYLFFSFLVGKAIRELGTCVITQKGETVVDTSFGDEEPVAQV